MWRLCGIRFGCALGVTLALLCARGALADAEELRGGLARVLEQAGADELVPVSIIMAEQADRRRLESLKRLGRHDRRDAVIAVLRDVAWRTQGGVLGVLTEAESRGRAERITPLWITNAVAARVTPDVAMRIAARDDVSYVNWDRPVGDEVFPVLPPDAGEAAAGGSTTGGEAECGIRLINADEVWSRYGITGAGVVVCIIDSGACIDHPDLRDHLWFNPGEIPNNFIDDDGNGIVDDVHGANFADGNGNVYDCCGHGSHVTGIALGDGSAGRRTGVAPDAQLMLAVWGGAAEGGEALVWTAIEYLVANGARVFNGSFGWSRILEPDRGTWRAVCDNAIAAGVVPVFGAGNGYDDPPFEVMTPADVPALIAVGAVRCDDVIADFSSRGPVTWQDVDPYFDHPLPFGLTKPDVSAPGVNTWSLDLCEGYTPLSGTSMAAPHVTGAVALMLEANPELTPEQVKQILMDTSVDLGAPGMDNNYGAGRIDALAAVEAALELVGCVVDWDGNDEVNAADVGAFLSDYFLDLLNGTTTADVDGNGVTNAADVGAFLSEYFTALANGGCE